MKLYVDNAVTQIDDGCFIVGPNGIGRTQVVQENVFVLTGNGLIVLGLNVVVIFDDFFHLVEGFMSGINHFFHPSRRRFAFGLQDFQGLVHAYGIPNFERPQFPAESGTHGIVDLVNRVGNFGNAMRSIGKEPRQSFAVKITGFVFATHQYFEAFAQIVDGLGRFQGGGFDLLFGPVFQGVQIQGQDFLLAVFFDFLVKALAGFVAQPFALQHFFHKVRQFEQVVGFVIRHIFVKPLRHVRQGVQAHNVGRAEGGRFGAAHYRPCVFVHFFHGKAQRLHQVENIHNAIHTDTVGDKGRRVFGQHGGFAQIFVAEFHEKIHNFGQSILGGNNFQQSQVAHRIKEVRPQEMFAEILRTVGRHQADGNPRCVGTDQGTGRTVFFHLVEHRLFDVQAFGHHFDNPIVVFDFGHVVFGIARADTLGKIRTVKSRRFGFECLLQVLRGNAVAHLRMIKCQSAGFFLVGQFPRHNVQQQNVKARIGQLCGNAGSHNTGTDNGNIADTFFHFMRFSGFFVESIAVSIARFPGSNGYVLRRRPCECGHSGPAPLPWPCRAFAIPWP